MVRTCNTADGERDAVKLCYILLDRDVPFEGVKLTERRLLVDSSRSLVHTFRIKRPPKVSLYQGNAAENVQARNWLPNSYFRKPRVEMAERTAKLSRLGSGEARYHDK